MSIFLKRFVLFFLMVETIVFVVLYCFGPNGLHHLSDVKQQRTTMKNQIEMLQHDVHTLENELLESRSDFSKEKKAREELLLRKENEIVYFRK